MKEEIKTELISHMRKFGLCMLGKGLANANVSEMLSPYNHAMAIVHIGHGTELIIKARIAQEHPLLIFSTIPKSSASLDSRLGIIDLLEKGQTITFSELPERLWAATGYKIPNTEFYNKFGKLRNQIIHLAVPNDQELSDIALQFGFGVIERLVNDWWDTTLLEFAREYDSEYLDYIFESLERLNLTVNYERKDTYQLTKKKNNFPFL